MIAILLFTAILGGQVAVAQRSSVPDILDYSFLNRVNLLESTPRGHVMGTVVAVDPDGTAVNFDLQGDGAEFFSINRTSGLVTLVKLLDYELKNELRMNLIVADEAQQRSIRECIVFVTDENDEIPVFQDPIFASISEAELPGFNAGTISVSDIDTDNDVITLECIRSTDSLRDACETFSLVPTARSNKFWRGYIQLSKQLDYEARKSYVILVSAWDGVHRVNDQINIEVQDINDSPPQWVEVGPRNFYEEDPVGFVIQTLTAQDPDTVNKHPIRYELFGEHTDVFSIDSVSGEISNAIRLDYDSSTSRRERPYDLTIRAREVISIDANGDEILGDDEFTTATVAVKYTMLDINDNSPTFNQPSFNISIPENIATGQNIPGLQMTVNDIDVSPQYNSFDLFTNGFPDVFGIIPTQDTLKSSPSLYILDGQKIDYETGPKQYIIVVTARENRVPASEAHSGSTTVTINVADVNDQAPIFDQLSYTVNVSETATAGTSIIDLNAYDNEEGIFGTSGIVYKLFGNLDHFQLSEQTGLLTVRNCAGVPGQDPCINYERKKNYVLTVSATDNGGHAVEGLTRSVQVNVNILDENDNEPQLEPRYLRYIYEEETVTINPLIIEAVDPDTVGGPLTYSIQGDGTNIWQITTGIRPGASNVYANITAVRPVFYTDAPDQINGEFQFSVVVQDTKSLGGLGGLVIIRVLDINNNAPIFIPVSAEYISENTLGDVFVTSVTASDRDAPTTGNGLIDFVIRDGAVGKFQMINSRRNADDTFSVDIHTTADARFNYDTQSEYIMTLEARDRGTPESKTGTATLTVYILDTNNRDPIIRPTSITINVIENTAVGTSVHRVIAEDPDFDKNLNYFMTTESALDPAGNDVVNSVYDFKSLFRIDGSNGIVYVNQPLDRDRAAFISNALRVEDVGATPAQTGTGALFIRITEYNDQAPEFTDTYNITIPEEIIRTSFVENLYCQDEDDDIAGYTITQQVPRFPDYFTLVGESGSLIVNERIDFEVLERIELTATCRDNGQPPRTATANVVVNILNINDNTPVFVQPVYRARLEEGSPSAEQFLIKVSADDIDKGDYGVVRYRLEDPDGFFRINEIDGNIYVLPTATFDREIIASYDLLVIAYDSPLDPTVRNQASVPVYITIGDANDNCPRFVVSSYSAVVAESVSVETYLKDIQATDADIDLNSEIVFAIEPNSGDPPESTDLFSVLDSSGSGTTNSGGRRITFYSARLLTRRSLKDRVGIYRFNVTATDMRGENPALQCTTKVLVEVEVQESQNDAPEWIRPPQRDFVISVLESQYEGMLVYNAKATDVNVGPNGVLDYYFVVEDGLVANTAEFRINQVTGVIRAEIIYDRESVDRYFLTLMARDQGNPAASSETTITVVILDVDDNDPKFPMKDGVVTPLVLPVVRENESPGVNGRLLGNCAYLATDADSDHENNRIYYRLIAAKDNERDYIRVNRDDCSIYLTQAVDYETLNSLRFDIYAFNEKNDDTVVRYRREVNPSILPVIVNIEDRNDNSPVFSQSQYLACASIDAPYRQNILEVLATDVDRGDNAKIRYSLRTGGNNFGIDASLGIIYNEISFRYAPGNVRVYPLDVEASDGITAVDTAKAYIFITTTSNIVRLKVNRPLTDVEPFRQQLINTVIDSSDTIKFACIDSMRNHVTGDGEESVLATDVMVTAVKDSGGGYSILSASELTAIIENSRSNQASPFNAIYVTSVKEHTDEESYSLEEDAVLAILIVAILLIFLAILLFCIACYCIRNSKKKKTKKLKAERHTIIQVAHEPVETSFNPVYHNAGREPDPDEYATVQKVKPGPVPITPVVIAAPEDLQPLPSEEPTHLVPIEPQQVEPTEVEPEEPVPFIETEVMPDPVPEHEPVQYRPFEQPEYEDRIETTVVDDEPQVEVMLDESPREVVSDEPPVEVVVDEPPVEVVVDEPPVEVAVDEPPVEVAVDESPVEVVLDESQPLPAPHDEEIEVEIRDSPYPSPPASP